MTVCTKAVSNSDGTPGTSSSPHVVCFGELLIDFVPTVNGVSLAEASAFKKAPGGAPANVAVGIARLGGSSAFIGKVICKLSSCLCMLHAYLCYCTFCLGPEKGHSLDCTNSIFFLAQESK